MDERLGFELKGGCGCGSREKDDEGLVLAGLYTRGANKRKCLNSKHVTAIYRAWQCRATCCADDPIGKDNDYLAILLF